MANISATADGVPQYRCQSLGCVGTASALAAEYGAGVNFVRVQSPSV
jgi:hypothetical protein